MVKYFVACHKPINNMPFSLTRCPAVQSLDVYIPMYAIPDFLAVCGFSPTYTSGWTSWHAQRMLGSSYCNDLMACQPL